MARIGWKTGRSALEGSPFTPADTNGRNNDIALKEVARWIENMMKTHKTILGIVKPNSQIFRLPKSQIPRWS